jgi:hypothetical protein
VTIPGAASSHWRTLRLLATCTPGGEEQALTTLPDFTRHPAGEIVSWERTAPGHA